MCDMGAQIQDFSILNMNAFAVTFSDYFHEIFYIWMIFIMTSTTVSTLQSRLERSMTQMVITLDIFFLYLKVCLRSSPISIIFFSAESTFSMKCVTKFHWSDMPKEYIYEPWTAPLSIQNKAKCIIGRDYPKPG